MLKYVYSLQRDGLAGSVKESVAELVCDLRSKMSVADGRNAWLLFMKAGGCLSSCV